MNNTARPLPVFTKAETDRFWSKVAIGDAGSCWDWQASTKRGGYGQFKIRGRSVGAHRVAFWLGRGTDPDALLVCHSCDHPPCCNPNHLFLGTSQDNVLDCKSKDRLNTATGLLHGSRTKPESRARGERIANAILSAETVAMIRSLYADGSATQQQLGDRFGVTREAISRITRGLNWQHLDVGDTDQVKAISATNRIHRGTQNASAKLTEGDVRSIRARHAKGDIGYRPLAAQYGVSAHLIALIIRREIWTHVD